MFSLPENYVLTDWELIERDGLRAAEMAEWREKRLIAETPNASSVVLARLADEVIAAWATNVIETKLQGHLLVETVAAHSNTPPKTLLRLLTLWTHFNLNKNFNKPNKYGFHNSHEWVTSAGDLRELAVAHSARGICRNPGTFHFWKRVDSLDYFMLLREGALSSQIVAQLAQCKMGKRYDSAHLHVAFAGEIQTQSEGIKVFKQYGPQIHIKGRAWEAMTLDPFGASDFYHEGKSYQWLERAYAALKLPLTSEPFGKDRWKRSPLQLMHHLAHDGNRFVRWVAQTRLSDPNFAFAWAKEA